jgi:hypothetical protein
MKRALITASVVALMSSSAPASAASTAWRFSEPDGSRTVISDNGVVGTLQNDGDPNGVVLKSGRLAMNGHGRVVVPESAADLDPRAAPFTASARVNTTVVPTDAIGDFDLARDGLVSHKRYWKVELLPNADNTKAFAFCQMRGYTSGIGFRSTTLKWTGANMANGVDHVIGCRKTDTQVTLTVDGVVRVTRSISIGSISNGAALAMGAKAEVWEDAYTGTIDDVVLSVG